MESLTVITDVLWLVAILIEGGKLLLKFFTLASIIPNSYCSSLQRKESLWYFVTSMVIQEGKTYSCMAATTLNSLKKQGCTLILCPRSVHSFHLDILALEIKSLRKQQLELQCLMR